MAPSALLRQSYRERRNRFVYVLHQGDFFPRYVGSTKDPESRMKGHTPGSAFWAARGMWLQRCKIDGIHVQLEVVHCVPNSTRIEAADVERHFMEDFRQKGIRLLNQNHWMSGVWDVVPHYIWYAWDKLHRDLANSLWPSIELRLLEELEGDYPALDILNPKRSGVFPIPT